MSEEVVGFVTSTGILQDGDPNKIRANVPVSKGRHLWTYLAIFKVDDPARSHQDFDSENLLSIVGPGCFHCEQTWYPSIGSKCPGEPSNDD